MPPCSEFLDARDVQIERAQFVFELLRFVALLLHDLMLGLAEEIVVAEFLLNSPELLGNFACFFTEPAMLFGKIDRIVQRQINFSAADDRRGRSLWTLALLEILGGADSRQQPQVKRMLAQLLQLALRCRKKAPSLLYPAGS